MSQKLTVPHPRKKIDKTTLIVLCVIGVLLLIGCVILGAAFDYALGADGSIDGSKISPAFRYVTSHPEVIISAITKKDGYVPKMLFVGVCVIGIFISMAGLKPSIPKKLRAEGVEIISCVDSDEAGQRFEHDNGFDRSESVRQKLDDLGFKDWNERLLFTANHPDIDLRSVHREQIEQITARRMH